MLFSLDLNEPHSLTIAIVTGICLALLAGVIYLCYRNLLLKNLLGETEKLLDEREHLQHHAQLECEKLRNFQLNVIKANATLTEQRQQLEQRIKELNADRTVSSQTIAELREANSILRERNADFRSKIDALDQLRDEDQERFALTSKQLEARLTALGERLLKERGEALTQMSSEQFRQAVSPLKAELDIFRNFLQQTQKNASEQAGALNNELKKMQQAQIRLSDQAGDLINALRAGGKSQGMWGELQLERVLEAAGLTKGIEYQREVAGNSLYAENGRPDAIVKLPDEHCLIIDAKCSLTDYTNYINAKDPETQSHALKAHLNSLRTHISTLAKRDYASYISFNSPSFVFMFVPVDGALTLAMREQSSIYDEAARINIYLVSPSTLIPALRVVSNLWMLSSQNERMRRLASEAQQIYSQFTLVLDAYEELCKKQDQSTKALTVLGDRLQNGRGNLQKRLEQFQYKAPGITGEPCTIQTEKKTQLSAVSEPNKQAQFKLLEAQNSIAT